MVHKEYVTHPGIGENTSDPVNKNFAGNREKYEVVIVGGGQAGISLAYYLQQRQIPYIILERDRAFSSWHNRWNGFHTNTPNWMNTLPVIDAGTFPGNDPDGFATREEIVDYFEKCLQEVNPHIRTNTDVYRITQLEGGGWEVDTRDCIYEARNVAICIGAMCTPKVPKAATDIPNSVPQLHSCEYQNPDQITTKSVLLVGSGSSGVQIGKLLGQSGRFEQIHLASSDVMVLPERLLGIQTHRLLHFFGLFDVRKDSIVGKLMYSGLETKGDPIVRPTPRDLAREYAVQLHGRFVGVDGSLLHFADGQTLATDDLTVIWCTGFRGDYSLIETNNRDAAFDKAGYPLHARGVVDGAPGLYFVGLRYQYTVASHDIYGVGKDARHVADHIFQKKGSSAMSHLPESEYCVAPLL